MSEGPSYVGKFWFILLLYSTSNAKRTIGIDAAEKTYEKNNLQRYIYRVTSSLRYIEFGFCCNILRWSRGGGFRKRLSSHAEDCEFPFLTLIACEKIDTER